MYNFQPIYTGENSAVKVPELDAIAKSNERNSELAIKGQEMLLNKSLKDKEAFYKLMEIDPVMAISTRDQEKQALMLDEYNNKGAAIMKRDGGRLTESGRMELMKEKALLTAKQNKILANQEQWKAAEQTMARDTRGYFDHDAYEQAKKKYFDTGEWDVNALQVAPQDITSLLSKDTPQSKYVDPKGNAMKDDKGNVLGYSSTEYKRSKDEAQERIFTYLQEEPVLKFVIKDFDSQPASVQFEALKDYDKNGNGKIDPEESKYVHQNINVRDNPIVKWAMNNPKYLASSMGAEPSIPKNIAKLSANKGGFSLNIGGSDYKYTPSAPIATAKFAEFYPFPKGAVVKIPVQNGRDIGLNIPLSSSEATDLTLTGYSKDKDEFIFLTNDANNSLTGSSNSEIAIPSVNVIDRLKDLMVMYNGKPTPIKSIIGSPTQATTPAKKKLY